MAEPIIIDGFVIVPPLSPWDKEHHDKIWAMLAPNSFGRTEAEAWRRHHFRGTSPQDFSQHVQHWFARGYRVKCARMEIVP
ncbi:hypothetical protein Q0601_17695 [Paracoccus onubensis]|uniref:hypothetical protein n=1 Tax=Paracoccus onubensis TaxID=1675788 RepID=UPI0027305E11|nr:hypothetical protein [Paracoccus onubensis]MDP0929022.1 hypothetical protein [Paracoccus onubensis]